MCHIVYEYNVLPTMSMARFISRILLYPIVVVYNLTLCKCSTKTKKITSHIRSSLTNFFQNLPVMFITNIQLNNPCLKNYLNNKKEYYMPS